MNNYDNYQPSKIEQKWLSLWNKSIYYFNWNDSNKPLYIIDTPPPYPTGMFHIGNALNWCYIDVIARYKRMNGYNVMFPQGWDCHGLPTEVKIEELYNITKNEISRFDFKEKCKQLTLQNIEKMKNIMIQLAFSIDWSNEFITMDEKYYKYTQKSFIEMYNKGLIYHEEHPVNWCPRCETAIAFAEVEYKKKKSKLNYILFKIKNENELIQIATSRPELLCSCVAIVVNDNDNRYIKYIGKRAIVPYYNYSVPIIGDNDVDPNFGTGVVMICTFGDKQDIKWVKKYKLKVLKGINKDGRMNSISKKYCGLTVKECREKIILDLIKSHDLYKQEELEQNVGICWRCKSDIEILSELQWFIKIEKNKILDGINKIEWYPLSMKTRIINWVNNMDWDWCISRQRIFATPIPIWYCNNCGSIIIADKDELPIDPTISKPKKKCICGSSEFHGETDVLDTWMDSSITTLNIINWDSSKLPVQIRQQGHDIIRTWSFYTILRTLSLKNIIPWEKIIVNGMVLGSDGHKMSKSLGNIIAPEEIINKYGVDSFRQWAIISGKMGSDIIFQWKDIISSSRFCNKLWNIYKFITMNIKDFNLKDINNYNINTLKNIDKWILYKLNNLIERVTLNIEQIQYDLAFKEIRSFVWDILADNYIEIIKGRLYNINNQFRKSSQYVLIITLITLSKILAPFIPYLSEEIYSTINNNSVHTEKWPKKINLDDFDFIRVDKEINEIIDISKEVRKYKKKNNIPLNLPLKRIEIYTSNSIDIDDLINVTKSNIKIIHKDLSYNSIPEKIIYNMNILGPMYKEKTKKIIEILNELNFNNIIFNDNNIEIIDNNNKYIIPKNAIKVNYKYKINEEEIEIITINNNLKVVIPK